MQKDVFLGKASFINFVIWIFFRKLHHYAFGRPDDLSSKENILQPEFLDLLPVFRSLNRIIAFVGTLKNNLSATWLDLFDWGFK